MQKLYLWEGEGDVNLASRMVNFSQQFPKAGIFKILNSQEKEAFYDLRQIARDKTVEYYAPFDMHENGDKIYCIGNAGWLSIKPNGKGGMHICS